MITVKEVIKQLEGNENYLSIHKNGKRLGGGFVFQPEPELSKFYDYEVLDIKASDTSDVVIIEVGEANGSNTRGQGKKKNH